MKNTGYIFADIGNTTIDIIFTSDTGFKYEKIYSSDLEKMKKTVAERSSEFEKNIAYISSVDKRGLNNFLTVIKALGIESQILDSEKMKEFSYLNNYRVDNIDIIGPDLFCDIVSVPTDKGLIVIDLGTASKILFLDKNKILHGGSIFPGICSFPEVLQIKTDLLGKNDILKDPSLVSLNTKESISSGAINGTACLLVKMVEEIKKQYDAKDALVYLTGGNANMIINHLRKFGLTDFISDMHLVNEGLARIFGYQEYQKMKEEIK